MVQEPLTPKVPEEASVLETRPSLVLLEGGQPRKELTRPAIDVEYHGVKSSTPGEQRVNLTVRLPKSLISTYKGRLVQLGARYTALDQTFRLPAYRAYAIALEEELSDQWKLRRASWSNRKYDPREDMDLSEAYLEWRDLGVEQFDELRIPEHLLPAWKELYSYQKDAVRWLVQNPSDHPGLLLALSPGLGKTIVTFMAAAILDLQRVLIVSPLSLLSVWQWEKVKWFGRQSKATLDVRLHSVHGDKPPESGWVVTNYNTLTSPRYNSDFAEEQWDLIVLDESVMVKNRKSQRFANVKNLRSSTDRMWLLSGSPITRHPNDLWSQFHLIEPRAWRSYWNFTRRWCAVETNVYAQGAGGHSGLKVTGSSGRNLRDDFSDILFVRNQEQVLPDLPDMIHQDINVSMVHQQHKAYTQMVQQYIAQLETGPEMDAPSKLAQLIRLQQIASNLVNLSGGKTASAGQNWPDASGKADVLMEMLEAETIEFPMLVWTHWKPGAIALAERLHNAGYKVGHITGDMPEEERSETFREFKGSANRKEKAKLDILILSLAVGKFGLTLTNTRTVVYMDKTWAADDYVQSIHRVHRIGLTHTPRVISLRCPGTIDDMIEDNLAGKMVSISHITNSDLSKMLRGLNRQLGIG